MSPKLAEDSEAVARFVREARAAARLVSPHVVSVLDVATLDDGTPYIVMERLVGCDLATLLERGGALEPSLAVGVRARGHGGARRGARRGHRPTGISSPRTSSSPSKRAVRRS
jgi:hypothetical protein